MQPTDRTAGHRRPHPAAAAAAAVAEAAEGGRCVFTRESICMEEGVF